MESVTRRKFWRIRQGRRLVTGREIAGWTVDLYGLAPASFKTLPEAKRFAVESGASGKWRRVRGHIGFRGRAVSIYYDANVPDPDA